MVDLTSPSHPILGGLLRKRQELVAELEAHQVNVRQVVGQLDALDAIIRLFAPAIDVQSVRVRPTPRRLGVQPGDTSKLVFELLREAGRPLTLRELMDRIMLHRGMNMDDKALRDMMRNRVGSSLRGMRDRRALASDYGEDGGLRFRVA